jgi:hypothetical protein
MEVVSFVFFVAFDIGRMPCCDSDVVVGSKVSSGGRLLGSTSLKLATDAS